MFQNVSFERDHHTAILEALRALHGDLLLEVKCFFGGGTAIVLDLGEYRESVDIDFLCADQVGYRTLRTAIAGKSDIQSMLREGQNLPCLREVRGDQYGLRTVVQSGDAQIKIEIVREARIELRGSMDARYGIPVLDRECMYAEKLLANSDRWYAPDAASRDIIDLSMMISRWGPIPEISWQIAVDAYGEKVREDYGKAVNQIRDPLHIEACARKMGMSGDTVQEILTVQGGAFPRPPSQYD